MDRNWRSCSSSRVRVMCHRNRPMRDCQEFSAEFYWRLARSLIKILHLNENGLLAAAKRLSRQSKAAILKERVIACNAEDCQLQQSVVLHLVPYGTERVESLS